MPDTDRLSRAHQHGDFAIIGATLYVAMTQTHRDGYADVIKAPSALYAIPVVQHYINLWGLSKVPSWNYISDKVDDALPVGHVWYLTKSRHIYKCRKQLYKRTQL